MGAQSYMDYFYSNLYFSYFPNMVRVMKETGLLSYDRTQGTISEINWKNIEKMYIQAVIKRRKGLKLNDSEITGLVAVLVRDYTIENYLKGDDIATPLPKV